MDVIKGAELLLSDVAGAARTLADRTAEANAALEELRALHAPGVQEAKEALTAAEKALEKHCKKHQTTIFGNRDRVDLKHGALLHGVRKVVRKAKKTTVELLERLGFTDGVLVTKSVNWDVIEKWTDERLAAIYTERKSKETWGYELKKAKEDRHG